MKQVAPYKESSITVTRDEDGVFIVEVPGLPGCISQGATREEALENINEAILAYVDDLERRGLDLPPGLETETFIG